MKNLRGRPRPLALVAALSLGSPTSAWQDPGQLPPLLDIAVTRGAVVGGEVAHVVVAGETLAELAASYGVDAKVLTAENGLRSGASLRPGQSLRIPSLHTLPLGTHDGIVVAPGITGGG